MQKLGASFMEFPLNPCPKGFPTIFLTHQPPFVTHGTSGKGLQLSEPQCSHLSFGYMMTNFNETMHDKVCWFFFPHHQAILPHQRAVLQLNSVLILSTWRERLSDPRRLRDGAHQAGPTPTSAANDKSRVSPVLPTHQ